MRNTHSRRDEQEPDKHNTEKGDTRMGSETSRVGKLLTSLVVLSVLAPGQVLGARESNRDTLEKLPHTFDFDGPAQSKPSLVLERPLPKMPKAVLVYKVKDPNVTEAYAREVGGKHFGIGVDAQMKRSRAMGLYWLTGSKWRLEVDPSTGSFNVETIGTDLTNPGPKETDPSKERCRIVAEHYLRSHKLVENDMYFRGVTDNTRSSWGAMSVGFGRLIGGTKSWGAGGRISVEIGLGGELKRLRKAWQELAPYRAYPIKTPQEALEELRAGKGVLMHGSKGKVEKIEIRYYTSPQKQQYVQPIYYFACNGADGSFYGILPAIKAEYLKPRQDASSVPMTWMKCRDPECQVQYQMGLREHLNYLQEYLKEHPNSPVAPGFVCERCGRQTAYRAMKCEKCDHFFQTGWNTGDFFDRCPGCKFSPVGERRKQREAARQRRKTKDRK
jgi:hypothetical protein